MSQLDYIIAVDANQDYINLLLSHYKNKSFIVIDSYQSPTKKNAPLVTQTKQAIEQLKKKNNMSKLIYIFTIPNNLIQWEVLKTDKVPVDDGVIKPLHIEAIQQNFLQDKDSLQITTIDKNCVVRLGDNTEYCVPNPIGVKAESLEIESYSFSWKEQESKEQFLEFCHSITPKTTLIYPSILSLTYLHENKNAPLIIDFSSKRVNFVFFHTMMIEALGSINMGVNSLLSDIAYAFDIPVHTAKDILRCYFQKKQGEPFYESTIKNQQRFIPYRSIQIVIDLRLQEICNLVEQKIEQELNSTFQFSEIILSGIIPSSELFKEKIKKFLPNKQSKEIYFANLAKLELNYNATYGLTTHFIKRNQEYTKKRTPFTQKIKKILGD